MYRLAAGLETAKRLQKAIVKQVGAAACFACLHAACCAVRAVPSLSLSLSTPDSRPSPAAAVRALDLVPRSARPAPRCARFSACTWLPLTRRPAHAFLPIIPPSLGVQVLAIIKKKAYENTVAFRLAIIDEVRAAQAHAVPCGAFIGFRIV